jgi:predicted transcriptional regulator
MKDVGALARRSVVTVGFNHTLAEAVRRMTEGKVGAAIVWMEDGQPGIISERDVMRALADGVDMEETRVSTYVTADAVAVSRSWDVVKAARKMIEGGFRHLVVLDDQGGPPGVLSIRDLVGELVAELEGKGQG